MTMNKKDADRIQKLMRMEGSDNENEAKIALAEVQKLLTKYNLTRADIAVSDYENRSIKTGKRQGVEDRHVNRILLRYFNVRLVLGSGTLYILGTKSDVEIATYTRAYLKNTFKASFRAMKLPPGSRSSFYLGLFEGLVDQLESAREEAKRQAREQARAERGTTEEQASQEQALALTKYDRKLHEFESKQFGRLRTHKPGRIANRDPGARSAGFTQGQNMPLNRGVGGGGRQALLN